MTTEQIVEVNAQATCGSGPLQKGHIGTYIFWPPVQGGPWGQRQGQQDTDETQSGTLFIAWTGEGGNAAQKSHYCF